MEVKIFKIRSLIQDALPKGEQEVNKWLAQHGPDECQIHNILQSSTLEGSAGGNFCVLFITVFYTMNKERVRN